MAGSKKKKAGAGKLEKAKIFLIKDVSKLASGMGVTVQFNPSEYQISRSLNLGKRHAVGRDQNLSKLQAGSGTFATFSVALYFDAETDLSGFDTSSLLSMAKSVVLPKTSKKPCDVCRYIASLLKYDPESHAPLMLRFLWGELDFIGLMASSSISYTMFDRDGNPVRSKLQLTLIGEETSILQKSKRQTFNSPNRTKERVLTQGDPLWLMAQQEYDDPAMWRTIAEANGILNPRRPGPARALRVPSIK